MRSLMLVLALFVSQSTSLLAHDFEWKTLAIASLKLRNQLDYEANVDSFMEAFRPDVWNKYHDDEFEMVPKRKETIEMMKQLVNSFSLQESFIVRTTTRLKNYDFESKKFPIDGWDESNYFYETEYQNGSFPRIFRVFMSNTEVFSGIPLNEQQAKEFIQSRKDRFGDIDRTVHMTISLKIVKQNIEPGDMVAEITKYRIYADNNHKKLIYEYEVPKSTEPPKLGSDSKISLAPKETATK